MSPRCQSENGTGFDQKTALSATAAPPPSDIVQGMHTASSRRELLLVSTSSTWGEGYLVHCEDAVRSLFSGVERVAFVPWALADHEGYAAKARERFAELEIDLVSVHEGDARKILGTVGGVFVGGGNTFRLLNRMYDEAVLGVIRERVASGELRYMGSSAGTNVATVSIRTTNDMPIVQPPSFDALGLVPFNINPHYQDPDPDSRHMGETREERIRQFHEENQQPVLGLREGSWLRVSGDSARVEGRVAARLFRRGEEPLELGPGTDVSFLLEK